MDQRMSPTLGHPGAQKGQPGEAFHVLFSPAGGANGIHKAENHEKQASPLARSASKQAPTDVTHYRAFRDYTPRKGGGFSPRGNVKGADAAGLRETQTPPPPTMSLLDTGSFQRIGTGVDTRLGDEREQSVAAAAGRMDGSRMFSHPASSQGGLVEDYDSRWVTVYGFNQSDLPLVLKEFSKCGDIVDYGRGTDGPYVNWIHICFDSKYGAQRALLRSGQQLSATCMIGVKEVDELKRETLGSGDKRELTTELIRHEPRERAEQRRNKKLIAAGEEPVVTLESSSVWDKFSEFVLGI